MRKNICRFDKLLQLQKTKLILPNWLGASLIGTRVKVFNTLVGKTKANELSNSDELIDNEKSNHS